MIGKTRRRRTAAMILFVSVALVSCSAQPTSSSPGDPADRTPSDAGASAKDPLASQPSVKWRARIGNSYVGTRSPVVAGRLVLALSDDNHVYALDRETGKTIWVQAPGGDQYLDSPVTDGKLLYLTGTNAVHALDLATGQQVWDFSPTVPGGGGLVLAQGRLIVGWSQGLVVYALDPSSGKVTWSWNAPKGSPGPMRVVGETVILSEADGSVDALDSKSGRVRWVSSPGPHTSRTLLAASPATVVLSSEPTDAQPSGGDISPYVSLVALDASDGDLRWSVPGVNSSSVVLTDKVLITGTGNGEPGAFPMRGVDPSNGQTLWEVLGSQQSPQVSTDEHRVYAWSTITSTTTDLLAIEPRSGQQRWEVQDVQQTDVGGGGGSSVVTVDGGMLFATNNWGEVLALQSSS